MLASSVSITVHRGRNMPALRPRPPFLNPRSRTSGWPGGIGHAKRAIRNAGSYSAEILDPERATRERATGSPQCTDARPAMYGCVAIGDCGSCAVLTVDAQGSRSTSASTRRRPARAEHSTGRHLEQQPVAATAQREAASQRRTSDMTGSDLSRLSLMLSRELALSGQPLRASMRAAPGRAETATESRPAAPWRPSTSRWRHCSRRSGRE